VFGDPQPIEQTRWDLAERFGWTLEYIEGLSVAKLHEFLQVLDGRRAASGSILRRG
jgi:hypothetical protein